MNHIQKLEKELDDMRNEFLAKTKELHARIEREKSSYSTSHTLAIYHNLPDFIKWITKPQNTKVTGVTFAPNLTRCRIKIFNNPDTYNIVFSPSYSKLQILCDQPNKRYLSALKHQLDLFFISYPPHYKEDHHE